VGFVAKIKVSDCTSHARSVTKQACKTAANVAYSGITE
jgi:hypothetical protein